MIPKTGCSCDFESFCLNCFQYKAKFFLVSNFFWHHIHIFLTKLFSSCRQPVKKEWRQYQLKLLTRKIWLHEKKTNHNIDMIWCKIPLSLIHNMYYLQKCKIHQLQLTKLTWKFITYVMAIQVVEFQGRGYKFQ